MTSICFVGWMAFVKTSFHWVLTTIEVIDRCLQPFESCSNARAHRENGPAIRTRQRRRGDDLAGLVGRLVRW